MDVLFYVPVAQLDRALDSDSKGRWFESSRAYQNSVQTKCLYGIFLLGVANMPEAEHFNPRPS